MPLRSVNPVPQYFDSSGQVLPFGKMFYFRSGSNDLVDVFADINGAIPIANPVLLDADGRLPNVFFDGAVKQMLTDANEDQQWSRDPVSSSEVQGPFSEWNSVTVYSDTGIVTGSDGLFYESIINSNQDNDPTTSPEEWAEIQFVSVWSEFVTYATFDTVKRQGEFYKSLVDNNIGNDPLTSGSSWQSLTTEITPVIQASSAIFANRNF